MKQLIGSTIEDVSLKPESVRRSAKLRSQIYDIAFTIAKTPPNRGGKMANLR
jgi:hypothetical protein